MYIYELPAKFAVRKKVGGEDVGSVVTGCWFRLRFGIGPDASLFFVLYGSLYTCISQESVEWLREDEPYPF